MKQRLKNWIIASASGAIFLGAGIGLYFGIRPSGGALSDDVKLRFESDSPKGMDALDLSSYRKRIVQGLRKQIRSSLQTAV